MSFKIRMSAVVALICVVGCSAQDPGPLNEVQSELADAQAEITKLKAELHETTKRLHDTQAKIGDSETKLFAAVKSSREAQAQVVEITAEKDKLAEQVEDLIKERNALKRATK
ncbi:MAG TPA: hypothetical protein VFG04_08190 [Planctomycetaceae bacterium]|jgi:septal ring factor EnvC (AmiA/AmiB activator)|nr:hypothetical protein [Planctomycetaceae bacterium]